MTETNKALVERLLNAFNEGQLSLLDEIISPDFVAHMPPSLKFLREYHGLKDLFALIMVAMPNAHHPSWIVFGEDDMVVTHLALEGRFTHEFMGIPPNGRKLAVWMVDIWRIEDGKIAEAWFNFDTLGLMQQMGMINEMEWQRTGHR